MCPDADRHLKVVRGINEILYESNYYNCVNGLQLILFSKRASKYNFHLLVKDASVFVRNCARVKNAQQSTSLVRVFCSGSPVR